MEILATKRYDNGGNLHTMIIPKGGPAYGPEGPCGMKIKQSGKRRGMGRNKEMLASGLHLVTLAEDGGSLSIVN